MPAIAGSVKARGHPGIGAAVLFRKQVGPGRRTGLGRYGAVKSERRAESGAYLAAHFHASKGALQEHERLLRK